MECPRGQPENRPQAQFCETCGTPLTANPSGPPAPSYSEITGALSEALERERDHLGPNGMAEEYAALAEAVLDDPALVERVVGGRGDPA